MIPDRIVNKTYQLIIDQTGNIKDIICGCNNTCKECCIKNAESILIEQNEDKNYCFINTDSMKYFDIWLTVKLDHDFLEKQMIGMSKYI